MNARRAPVSLEPSPYKDPPEIELWRAVLLQAVVECRGGESVPGTQQDKRYAQQRAQAWIFSTRKDPGSFYWCCEVLAVDPRAVYRRALSVAFSGRR
jgi:hypothetical protein